MSYIGNQPTSVAFLTDSFNGTGSQTAFTMSVAPANTASVLVAVSGVLQDPSTYSVSGTTLTFSAAPPSGTGNISARYLGIPASGIATTAYRTQTEFTATAGQTTFTPPSYTVGFIDVYRNGVLLGSADYTASNGTTVVLTNPAAAGDLVETTSFLVSSVLNALPLSGGNLSGNLNVTAGNVGIGITAPTAKLHVTNTGAGDSFLVEDSINPDATPFIIDANGRALTYGNQIGYVQNTTVLPVAIATSGNGLLNWSGNLGTAQLTLGQQISSSTPPIAAFYKSRGGSTATPTAALSGDATGSLRMHGYDGTAFIENARIEAYVDGTPGTNDMPGRLVFSTTADGASSPTEQMRITSTGLLHFNSGYGSAAVAYGCRAWVKFNGTGTPAINGSGNVTSITDSGTGQYTVNFTTAMPDTNYSLVGTTKEDTRVISISSQATSNAAIRLTNAGGALEDQSIICVSVFR